LVSESLGGAAGLANIKQILLKILAFRQIVPPVKIHSVLRELNYPPEFTKREMAQKV
jgi:hypothetical protein